MKDEKLDALLLAKPANMFYLTGDGRLCAYAMITKDGKVALGVPHFKHFGIDKGAVGLEYTFLTISMKGMLTYPHAKPSGVEVKDCTNIMSKMRTVKDDDEIERIKAAEAEYAMRQAGAEEFWRTYVSSGERTNIAHGLPTHRKLKSGDPVMIDIHPIVNGYSADICRTVCVGKSSRELQASYDLLEM